MSEIPYLGLKPFSEENAPFFFGRDAQKRDIAKRLRISRLTVLLGQSGVGKSSILGAGVVPQLRRNAEQNWQDSGTPQLAVVLFRDWQGENPLKDLIEKIRDSVAEAMKIKPTHLRVEPKPAESLRVWTKILGGEQGSGQLFIILDQFEEYFQSHAQESGKGTFADEFPRWVNRSDLRVNFLIAMREDALAKLHRFQERILDIFNNQIELKRLDLSAARDAIVKPIGEYNLRQIVTHHLQTSRLTVLSGASGTGKSRILKEIVNKLRGVITFRSWQGNPLTDLVAKLETELKTIFPNISTPEPRTSLTETLQGWAECISREGENTQLFIVLDQFEEFFQYQPPAMEEGSFVAEFSRVVTHPQLPVHFLISIDEEATNILKHFEERIPKIFDHLLQMKQLGENPAIADLVKPIEETGQQSSQAIDIEPQLVEEVLNQLSALSRFALIGRAERGISRQFISQENVEIEAPLLQLVMEHLWTEEVDKKRAHCLSLTTLNALRIPEKKIYGAQRIVNDHLSEQMEALSSDREKNAMAIVFKYLVSSEGTKIAYPVLDLPEPTGLKEKELKRALKQLDDKRILRTVKVPTQVNVEHYEIFHDILAWPILNWRDRYFEDKKQKELDKKLKEQEDKKQKELDKKLKEQEEKGKQKARKRIQLYSLIGGQILLLGILASLSLLVLGLTADGIRDLEMENIEIKEARKAFHSSPPKASKSGEIVGLIKAMEVGQRMRSKYLKDRRFSWNLFLQDQIETYKTDTIRELQGMLKKIKEKNYIFLQLSNISSLSFSPDGQRLAAGLDNGTVRLWTFEDEKLQETQELKLSGRVALSLSFSHDGQRLAAGLDNGTVRLWTFEGDLPKT